VTPPRYHPLIKRRFFILLAYLCFLATFLSFTLLAASGESPVAFPLYRGHRSHWLYAAHGTLGYRRIEPNVPGTPAWTSTSDDTWYYYPLDKAVTIDRHFLGFGYAHQSSSMRGESGRCWINLILLALLFVITAARLAFGPATATPLQTIPVNVPSSNDPDATVPILAYSSGRKQRIPHPIGIRIFSASIATFLAGVIGYFLIRSTLAGRFIWIPAIVVCAGGLTFFSLIAIGRLTKRV